MPDAPDTPRGITKNVFGEQVMRWGTKDAAARERMRTLTRAELVAAGVTAKTARDWAEFYENEIVRIPRNPSARGRAELMRYAQQLLESQNE